MKFLAVSIFLSVLSIDLLCSEKKWIPIQPIKSDEISRSERNTSKPQTSNKTIQNLKIIKNLLDHVNKEGVNAENGKNWYSLDTTDGD